MYSGERFQPLERLGIRLRLGSDRSFRFSSDKKRGRSKVRVSGYSAAAIDDRPLSADPGHRRRLTEIASEAQRRTAAITEDGQCGFHLQTRHAVLRWMAWLSAENGLLRGDVVTDNSALRIILLQWLDLFRNDVVRVNCQSIYIPWQTSILKTLS